MHTAPGQCDFDISVTPVLLTWRFTDNCDTLSTLVLSIPLVWCDLWHLCFCSSCGQYYFDICYTCLLKLWTTSLWYPWHRCLLLSLYISKSILPLTKMIATSGERKKKKNQAEREEWKREVTITNLCLVMCDFIHFSFPFIVYQGCQHTYHGEHAVHLIIVFDFAFAAIVFTNDVCVCTCLWQDSKRQTCEKPAGTFIINKAFVAFMYIMCFFITARAVVIGYHLISAVLYKVDWNTERVLHGRWVPRTCQRLLSLSVTWMGLHACTSFGEWELDIYLIFFFFAFLA